MILSSCGSRDWKARTNVVPQASSRYSFCPKNAALYVCAYRPASCLDLNAPDHSRPEVGDERPVLAEVV